MRFKSAPRPSWPARQKWLTRFFDDDFFKEPIEVELISAPKPNGDAIFRPLAEFASLKRLSLNCTGAGDQGMPYLRALPDLRYLDVSRSQAGDAALANMSQLSELEELILSGTRVTDAGLPRLAGLARLKTLDLARTKVGDEALRMLAGFPRLERLSLAGASLTGGGFEAVRSLPALIHLDLSGTAITDAGLRALPPAPALQTLRLNDTAISDDGLSRLGRLTSLRTLELCGTTITGKALRHLQALPWLSYLNLCGTRIDDGDIDALNEMCSLVSVSLLDTRVTEAGLNRLEVAGSLSSEPVDARTMAALRDLTELDFTRQPLSDVVDYLKQRHDQEIQVDRKLQDGDDARVFRIMVTNSRNDISLLQALEDILAHANLVLVYRHSVPIIMARPVQPALVVPSLAVGEELSPRLQFALTQKTELDFARQPLPDIVRFLAHRHAIEIGFDDGAFGRSGRVYDLPATRTIKGISLRAALGLLLEPLDMICVAQGDALVIRPAAEK